MCGDFNTFPDDKGHDQMRILKSKGLYEGAYPLFNLEGKRIEETFLAYPYDMFKKSEEKYPLDHIMGKGVIFEAPVCHDELELEFKGKYYGISDHFPITINFSLV